MKVYLLKVEGYGYFDNEVYFDDNKYVERDDAPAYELHDALTYVECIVLGQSPDKITVTLELAKD